MTHHTFTVLFATSLACYGAGWVALTWGTGKRATRAPDGRKEA